MAELGGQAGGGESDSDCLRIAARDANVPPGQRHRKPGRPECVEGPIPRLGQHFRREETVGDVVGLPTGRHSPGEQHDQPIALARLGHVVRRDENPGTALGGGADQLPEPRPSQRPDAGNGLVEYQQVGPVRQRCGESDATAEAERQLTDEAVAYGFELRLQRRGVCHAETPRDEGQVLPDGQVFVQPEALGHVADARRFLIRFAIGVFLVFAFVIAGPLIVIGQLLAAVGLPMPAAGFLTAAVSVALVVVVFGGVRSARRIAIPFGDLIEAAGRVEAGDYSARVSEYHLSPRELRSLLQAFNAMAARLEMDEQQHRSLLAYVSHELRTPLAVLRGDLEAMLDGIHPTDQAHLAAAVDEVGLLTQLVEDLRTLALAEAGTLALHAEPTDIAILAHDSAAAFSGLAEEADVKLEVEAMDDMPLVDLDPLRIRQVLVNLIANALHYASRGSVVRVIGRREGGFVAISVSDEGRGIAPEVLPHLFERFAKSDDSRSSGLGLAIARRLVEAHGGTIRAELGTEPAGAPGGTVIRFELPIDRRT